MLFYEIMPINNVIIWRNRYLFLTLRQEIIKIMITSIIGREFEIECLKKYIDSNKSEFIAIYGRRRIGKTFLVKELFEGKFSFRITGRENADLRDQLAGFSYAMFDYFGDQAMYENWTEAFRALSKAVERQKEGTKIIFIDELPWFDTHKSKFISALEHFWNNWAYYRSDIKLIVCGSAASWMLNKVINARGGLHNRVTHKMLMSPFSLKEVEQYFHRNGFNYEREEIIDSYMAVGGVAYYLTLFDNDKSVAENINKLCFRKGGELVDEFEKLYKSIFKKSDNHIAVINAIGKVGKGMTRLDIISTTGIRNNGNLSTILKELESCEFIRSYLPFGKSRKDRLYQLIDQFSLFYLRFMNGKAGFGNNHWQQMIGGGEYNAWSGYAFETACLHHIDQMLDGLGISGMLNTACSWAYRPTEAAKSNPDLDEDLRKGAQIDLLIDRKDKTITMCEMKYSNTEFEIDKAYDKHVQERIRIFKKVTKTKKSVSLAYVTPCGLVDNMYARKSIRQITAENLFK